MNEMQEWLDLLKRLPLSSYKNGNIGISYVDIVKKLQAQNITNTDYIKFNLIKLEQSGLITILRMPPPNDGLIYAVQLNQ